MINQNSNTDIVGISNDLLAVLFSKRPLNLPYHETTLRQLSLTVVNISIKEATGLT